MTIQLVYHLLYCARQFLDGILKCHQPDELVYEQLYEQVSPFESDCGSNVEMRATAQHDCVNVNPTFRVLDQNPTSL